MLRAFYTALPDTVKKRGTFTLTYRKRPVTLDIVHAYLFVPFDFTFLSLAVVAWLKAADWLNVG
jgi:hypothetical protein